MNEDIGKHKMNEHEYVIMFNTEEQHWWYRGLRGILRHWITKIKPTKVLDAGSGTGIDAFMIQGMGHDVYANDANEMAVEFCKKRGIKNIKQGYIQDLQFADETFDCIYSMDVIQMVEPEILALALKEFVRCLKPGGYVIINTSTLQWLFSKHDIAVGVVKKYSKKELKAAILDAGLNIEKLTYRYFLLFIPLAIVKLIGKIGMRAKKTEEVVGDLELSNWFINWSLSKIMLVENFLLKYMNLPIGTSLFVVAQKPVLADEKNTN